MTKYGFAEMLSQAFVGIAAVATAYGLALVAGVILSRVLS